MKLFQKTYPLISIVLLMSGGTFFAKDRELQMITSVHTKVFSRDNLFNKKNDETNDWYKLLDDLQRYVNENADGNPKLIEAFAICKDVSTQLINTLKIVYNSIFFSGRSPSQANLTKARTSIEQLEERKADLDKMDSKLKTTYYFLGNKPEVKKMLLRLIVTLDLTIEKLGKDFYKQVNKRGMIFLQPEKGR